MLTVSATGMVSISTLTIVLILAFYFDIKSHRIPNFLILIGFTIGFALQGYILGPQGIGFGIAGLLTGFAVLLPMYALGGTGAGDVKLMAAVGLFLGSPANALVAGIATLIVGGICGVTMILVQKDANVFISRYLNMLKYLIITGNISYTHPSKIETASVKFPYAVAIGVGTAVTVWLILNCSRAYKGILG